ncbi:Yip1 family protein [Pseudoroseicyclus sp. H15]
MTSSPNGSNPFLRLIAESFRDPSSAARELLDMRLSRAVLWPGIILIAVVTALLAGLPTLGTIQLAPGMVALQPFGFAIIAAIGLVAFVVVLDFGGRALGGQGDFTGAMTVVLWIQVLSTVLGLAQLLLAVIFPPILVVTAFAVLILEVWISVHFVNELHRFGSLMKSFLMLIGFGLALIVTAAILLAGLELLLGGV